LPAGTRQTNLFWSLGGKNEGKEGTHALGGGPSAHDARKETGELKRKCAQDSRKIESISKTGFQKETEKRERCAAGGFDQPEREQAGSFQERGLGTAPQKKGESEKGGSSRRRRKRPKIPSRKEVRPGRIGKKRKCTKFSSRDDSSHGKGGSKACWEAKKRELQNQRKKKPEKQKRRKSA